MSVDLVPKAEARALAALDEARKLIGEARAAGDVDALREWRDRAAATQHYARTRDEAAALADDAGEVKLRAERALGQLDAEANPPHRGVASPSEATEVVPGVASATRAAWRKLGQLDDSQFEHVVDELRADALYGVTTAAAARLATAYLPAPPPKTRQTRVVELPSDDVDFDVDTEVICPTCHGTGRVPLAKGESTR